MAEEYEQDEELTRQLRALREQVRRDAGETQQGLNPDEEQGYLYGNRDLRLFPRLQEHLAELDSLYVIHEQPFTSSLPVVGPLIAWFRERWNRISTKWYVRPLLEQQIRFNAALVTVLQDLYQFHRTSSLDLVRRMDALFEPLEQNRAGTNARLQDLSAYQKDLHAWIQGLQDAHEDLSRHIRELLEKTGQMGWQLLELQDGSRQLTHQQALDRRAMTFLRAELERTMALVAGTRQPSPEEQAEVDRRRQSLRAFDYYRFEDRYRPEDTVREEQRLYLSFFEGRSNVLDLGCGKGEFLELLRSEQIEAYGIDVNEPMVRMCQEKGLLAFQADALEHLAGLPDASLGGLFAAHLVEHLSTGDVVRLFELALAKLQPEAVLIVETPNPLCVWALVNYFYLDLSHVRPVHPATLSFLLELQGFRDVEVRYLHPVPEQVRLDLLPETADVPAQETVAVFNRNVERLNDLLYGYADYAAIARK